MQYQVPQFIEVEDKIFGPLTLKQFVYIAGSLGTGFVLWNFLPKLFAVPVGLAVIALGFALAFIKVNSRPLAVFIRSLFDNIWSPKVYVFKPKIPTRQLTKDVAVVAEPKVKLAPQETPLAGNKTTAKKAPLFGGIRGLREWIATSKTAIPKREKPLPRNFGLPQKEFQDRFEVVRHLTGEREVAKRIDYR